MRRMSRTAILLSLIQRLKGHGSWCGETHIQKATYFLEDLTKVPLDFEFILYKHGPNSFDLNEEITILRANNFLSLEVRPFPYGPSFGLGENADDVLDRFPKTTEKYRAKLDYTAQKLGALKVADLERLATALYVTLNEDGNPSERAHLISKLKPHISLPDAQAAVESIDQMIEEVKDI